MFTEVNHSKTSQAINGACECIKQQTGKYTAYGQKIQAQASQAVYSTDYLEKQATAALTDLLNTAEGNRERFAAYVDQMRECEAENDKCINFEDDTLKGALSIIQALAVPELVDPTDHSSFTAAGRVIYSAIQQLRGQRNALFMIKDAMAGKGVQVPEEWNKYFYSDGLFDDLDKALFDLAAYPRTAAYYGRAIASVNAVCEILGLPAPAVAFDPKDQEQLQADAMRAAFGL